MSAAFDFYPPGEQKQRHIGSPYTGGLYVRTLHDDSIEVVGVAAEVRVLGQHREVIRHSPALGKVVATYPAGTRVEQVGS